MKSSVFGWILVVGGMAAPSAVSRQVDGWTGVFTLAPGSYSLLPGNPLYGNSPADVFAPGLVPQRVIPRQRISWPDLGLSATGVVDALSFGRDECNTGLVFFFFSVTAATPGLPGGPVNRQFLSNGAAGDIFVLVGKGCPAFRGVGVEQDAPDIVLQPGPGGLSMQDELNNLDVPAAYAPHEGPIYFSVNPATATSMSSNSGTPVTAADLLVSDGRGNWEVLYDHAELGLSALCDVDAVAYDAAFGKVWLSVLAPCANATGTMTLDPATIYLVTPTPPSTGFVSPWILPPDMTIGSGHNVDAISILDPDSFFGPSHDFLCLDFTGGGTTALPEEGGAPGGMPGGTAWHVERACDATYSVSPSFNGFASIAGNPSAVTLFDTVAGCPDDANSGWIPISIPFSYFGAPVQGLVVSTNGFVTFEEWLPGLDKPTLASLNAPVGDCAPPQAIAAPFWDDLQLVLSNASVAVLEDVSAQTLTVEWNLLSTWTSPGPCTWANNQLSFQLILHGGSDAIEFLYDPSTNAPNATGTVGIENWSGGVGLTPLLPPANTSPFPPTSNGFLFQPSATSLPPAFNDWAIAYNGGDSGAYHYDTAGTANRGAFRSPPFAVPPGAKNLSLSFDSFRDMDGGTDERWVEVRENFAAASDQILFLEPFGGGLGAYTETDGAGNPAPTLWHGEAYCEWPILFPLSWLPGGAAAYNQGDVGIYTYNTGATNEGAIESPPIPLGGPPWVASLSFEYMKETEANGNPTFDQAFVESRPLGGSYATDLQVVGNSVCAVTCVSVELGATAASIQHRFRFDTFDSVSNDYLGWMIDNVQVTRSQPVGWNAIAGFSPQVGGTDPCSTSTFHQVAGGPIAGLAGQGGEVRFRVDTVDGAANSGKGWIVDNVKVQGGPVGFAQQFGTGCKTTGGPVLPSIGFSGAPVSPTPAGVPFVVTLSNGLPSTPAWLAISLDSAATPVPFLGNPNCLVELQTSPGSLLLVLVAPANASGSASKPFVIPAGFLPSTPPIWVQWAQLTPALQYALSDAAVIAVR